MDQTEEGLATSLSVAGAIGFQARIEQRPRAGAASSMALDFLQSMPMADRPVGGRTAAGGGGGVAGARNLCLECEGCGEACSDLPEARCAPTSPCQSVPRALQRRLQWADLAEGRLKPRPPGPQRRVPTFFPCRLHPMPHAHGDPERRHSSRDKKAVLAPSSALLRSQAMRRRSPPAK